MTMQVSQGDVFAAKADALIVTLDGAKQGLRGNVAHGFLRRWPEAYEDFEAQVRFPMRLGTGQLVALDNDSPFAAVLFVSTLHHLDTFTDEQKLGVLRAAFVHALDLAQRAGIRSMATTVLKGGWRLEVGPAYEAMRNVYPGTRFAQRCGRLDVYMSDAAEYAALTRPRS
jgi:hypothetical protein